MNISNVDQNVPAQVQNLLLSYVPYGSEYCIYCSSYSSGSQAYDLIYKAPTTNELVQYRCSRQNMGSWTVTQITNSSTFDGFSTENPYYAISSVRGAGVYQSLPYTNNFIPIMLIVIASILVLRLVFGGIKWFADRKKHYV